MTTPNDATTSYDVRGMLEHLLERDLLGPRDGEHEELPPGVPPAERYLLGRLVPRTRPSDPPGEVTVSLDDGAADNASAFAEEADPDLVDRELTGASEVQGDDLETGQATRTGTMAASALGCPSGCPRMSTGSSSRRRGVATLRRSPRCK